MIIIFLVCSFQLNLSIFAGSQYNLSFNLYPLKAGWQSLPAFELKYYTPDDTTTPPNDELYSNFELQSLVDRWMPKRIYIIVSIKVPAFLRIFFLFV